jgi:hypothetical protein
MCVLTQLYAAVSPKVVEGGITGKYFAPIAQLCEVSDHAANRTLQKRVWEFTETLLDEKGFS